ncbi:TfoX/Sxy family protein [Aquimarina sp. M1]
MAYSEFISDRIHQILKEKKAFFYAKKMMGGLCFMVEDKMCCSIHYDKKRETDLLMARIGEEAYTEAIKRKGCHPMDFTGRPMRGYVFVTPEGFDLDEDLEYWIQLCIDFNPIAKSSKKRK